jgi:hypothetical protein
MGSHVYNNVRDLYENYAFTEEMSSRMQVPKRIIFSGGKIELICYFVVFYFTLKALNILRNQ